MAIHASAGLTPFQPSHPSEIQRRTSLIPRETPSESLCSFQLAPLILESQRRYSHSSRHSTPRSRANSFSLLTSTCSVLPATTIAELNDTEQTRITINVRGAKFETYKATLEQFPETLLGSAGARCRFYDSNRNELFFDRDPHSFDAILFFYQSKGKILARPESVDEELFSEEVRFYGLADDDESDIESVSTIEENFSADFGGLKRKIWTTLEYPFLSTLGRFWSRLSILFIALSVITYCLETMPELNSNMITQNELNLSNLTAQRNNLKTASNKYENFTNKTTVTRNARNSVNITITSSSNEEYTECNRSLESWTVWFVLDTVFVLFFTAEYVARIYSAPNRWKFIRTFLAIVDLIAIAPYYIAHIAERGNLCNVKSFNVVRAVRLFRVARLLQLYRYITGLKLLGRALHESRAKMASLIVCVVMAVVLFSSALYYIEGFVESSSFESIPASFWWSIITMSTVGYGDIVPRTPIGKLTGAFCAFTGIILLYILPIPVFVSHFSKLYEARRKKIARKLAKMHQRRSQQRGTAALYKTILW